jgi:hypothetical protein
MPQNIYLLKIREAITLKDLSGLAKTTEQLAVATTETQSPTYAKVLLELADHLADKPTQAMVALQSAVVAHNAVLAPALEERAREVWKKAFRALPQSRDKVEAFVFTEKYTNHENPLHYRAHEEWYAYKGQFFGRRREALASELEERVLMDIKRDERQQKGETVYPQLATPRDKTPSPPPMDEKEAQNFIEYFQRWAASQQRGPGGRRR